MNNKTIVDSRLRPFAKGRLSHNCRLVGNMCQKFSKFSVVPEISLRRDRQRDTQTYQSMLNNFIQISWSLKQKQVCKAMNACILCYTMLQVTTGATANLSTQIYQLWYICRWITIILSG